MLQLLRAGLLIVAIALIARPHEVSAEIYEWVDSEGRTQYTNELNRVPASQRTAAKARASSRPEVVRVSTPEAEVSAEERSEEMECRPDGWCFSKGANITSPEDRYKQSQSTDPAKMKVDGRDKVGWKRSAQQYRDRIALLERQIEQMEAAGADHAPRGNRENVSPRNRSRYLHRHWAWQKAKRDLAREQGNYERFMENARRAGVPPGWLR